MTSSYAWRRGSASIWAAWSAAPRRPSNRPPPWAGAGLSRAGKGPGASSERHTHYYPAADLLGKMMVPIIIEVKARSVDDIGGLVRHSEEEYLYVLEGAMELHSDLYAPLLLSQGDSIYFDSGMAHCYVQVSEHAVPRARGLCRAGHATCCAIGRKKLESGLRRQIWFVIGERCFSY